MHLNQSPGNRVRSRLSFFLDRDYFTQLTKYGLPVMFQQLIVALLGMVGVVMVGQAGDAAVAAVGLAGQVFFLLNLIIFGLGSGSAIFTAQLWGRQDLPRLRKVLSLSLVISLVISLLAFLACELLPTAIISIFSKDPAVIGLGGRYLRIFAWSFLPFTITAIFTMILRSTGSVRLPMLVSISALALNTLLTWALIFGRMGLPALGVQGAAVAVVLSRLVECIALLLVMHFRRSPLTLSPGELFSFDPTFIMTVLKPVLPVILNEMLWSLGVTVYSVVYARMGTASIAAINMVSTIENVTFAVTSGITTATAIMVGNQIGSGREDQAFHTSLRSLILGVIAGLLLGAAALLGAQKILDLYKVSPAALQNAKNTLLVFGGFLWLKATNMILLIGALRAGGDTRFGLIVDGYIIWLVGVPAALLGAFVFHLPVQWVYLLVLSEELTKCIASLWRFASRKWIHNLAATVSNGAG